MATTYPGAKQTWTNASGTATLSNPDHSTFHAQIQDTIAAMEDVVGTTTGTNVLKAFAAGDTPLRVSTGSVLQQTINLGTTGTVINAHGTLNAEVGTLGTYVGLTGTVGTLQAGTYSTVNSIPGSALGTNATLLAYTQTTANITTASQSVVVAGGLIGTVTIPSGGRSVKITAFTNFLTSTGGTAQVTMSIWQGTVSTGTQLTGVDAFPTAASSGASATAVAVHTPAAGLGTYTVGLKTSANTGQISGAVTTPNFILVELI
jgi:hypothetical protein